MESATNSLFFYQYRIHIIICFIRLDNKSFVRIDCHLRLKLRSKLTLMTYSGGSYFAYPLFCNVPLILYDFPFLKLQNKGNILCIQDWEISDYPKFSKSRYIRCYWSLQSTKNENTNFQFLLSFKMLPFNKNKKRRDRLNIQQKQWVYEQKNLNRLSLKKKLPFLFYEKFKVF